MEKLYQVYDTNTHDYTVIGVNDNELLIEPAESSVYKIAFSADLITLEVLEDEYYKHVKTWKVKKFTDYCWRVQKTQIQVPHGSGVEIYDEFTRLLAENFATCWITGFFYNLLHNV